VAEFVDKPDGFSAGFNFLLDQAALNLYDIEDATLGQADATLVGDAVGAVAGSLVVDTDRVTFVSATGLLAPDTYTVTLRSASDGFRSLDGGLLLDGDDDGVEGDDFFQSFTVSSVPAVVVSLPDLACGPGQAVNVPATHTGIPVRLSEGSGVNSVVLTVKYDPALLDVIGAELGSGMPADASLEVHAFLPGEITLTFSSVTPLPAGLAILATITASVPDSAAYGAAQVLDITVVEINSGAISAEADSAIQLAAFFGDATGNGYYSGLDAQKVARVAVCLDEGLEAFPTIDPMVVADITRDGSISGLDAQRIAQTAVNLNPIEIPPLPGEPLRGQADPSGNSGSTGSRHSKLDDSNAPGPSSTRLTEQQLVPLVADGGISFEIVDLPGDCLGEASSNAIRVDVNTADDGWLIVSAKSDTVGPYPSSDKADLTVLPCGSAHGRADLLTLVPRESGDVLEYDQLDGGVREESLNLVERRVWEDESLLDHTSKLSEVLDASDLSASAIDGYFAAT
jgi:hypothetical protein